MITENNQIQGLEQKIKINQIQGLEQKDSARFSRKIWVTMGQTMVVSQVPGAGARLDRAFREGIAFRYDRVAMVFANKVQYHRRRFGGNKPRPGMKRNEASRGCVQDA
jgi:hypothetical protein